MTNLEQLTNKQIYDAITKALPKNRYPCIVKQSYPINYFKIIWQVEMRGIDVGMDVKSYPDLSNHTFRGHYTNQWDSLLDSRFRKALVKLHQVVCRQ